MSTLGHYSEHLGEGHGGQSSVLHLSTTVFGFVIFFLLFVFVFCVVSRQIVFLLLLVYVYDEYKSLF